VLVKNLLKQFCINPFLSSLDLSELQLSAAYPMRGCNVMHWNVSPFRGPNATQAETVNFYSTNGAISGSPIYDKDNNVIFGSEDKNLYRFRYDLSFSSSFLAEGPIKSTPAIDNSGNVYFAVRLSRIL